MIRDLQLADDGHVMCDAQVCIVGAGTAGIFLASQLRKLGLQVVLLEAGDRLARKPEEVDQHCEQCGIRYRGADSGRSFGLGGTSALWGGQMLPLARTDLEARSDVGFDAWPIDYEEMAAYLPVVRQTLGLSAGVGVVTDTELLRRKYPALRSFGDFDLRLSAWLPFKRRNFANAFSGMLKGNADLIVWLNAAVVSMTRTSSADNPRIETLTAQSPNGHKLQVRASVVVVCAGALESTRLLLAYDEATAGSIVATGAPLGRYFADHLSVTCGHFICRDWRRYNLAVAPIFERGLMRTPRLELSGQTQKRLRLTSAYAHFTFVTHGDTGFDVVRNILRRRQGERNPLELTPSLLRHMVTDVSAMAFWRGAYRRLWIPRQAVLLLQVDIEQSPNPDSRLTLSHARDGFGRKRLAIDWRIMPQDLRVIRKVAELAMSAWHNSPLRDSADLELSLPEDTVSFDSLYGVYHPTGSLRMGSSAASSVVNKDLRLWETENCYLSTTAVFPSAGSANPGITHLALTARLAEHLSQRLRSTAIRTR